MVESSPLVSIFRRLAHVALALLGGVAVSRPLSAQLVQGLDTAGRVVVSRNEVRVYFPPLPMLVRSSPVTPGTGKRQWRMMWAAQFDDATTVRLWFRDSATTQSVPSLPTIVRTGEVSFCRENMVNSDCSGANLVATIENGRIVVSYRDTAEIRQSFGLHPAAVVLLLNFPPEMGDGGIFAAPVQYIDPPILLDSAQRVAVGKERRRREASINSYSRGIIATLHRSSVLDEASSGYPSNDVDRARKLVARRAGRTMLLVSGVYTAADTLPSRTPLDSILEREIIVTPARRRP